MARLHPDEESLVLKMDPSKRAQLLEELPDRFYLTPHYEAHPLVLVNLNAIQEGSLQALLEDAWRFVAPKRMVAQWEATKGG